MDATKKINFKKYYEANDSLQNDESRKMTLELEKKYQTEKKEKQLIVQESFIRQKNTLNYILGGSIAALLLIIILVYRNYTQKRNLQQQKITTTDNQHRAEFQFHKDTSIFRLSSTVATPCPSWFSWDADDGTISENSPSIPPSIRKHRLFLRATSAKS